MRERWYGPHVLRRLPALMLGLAIFGVSIALMVRSDLGLTPWETFHQGISRQTGLAIGTVGILLGIPILLLWIPLRQWPGIGTALNIVTVGTVTNLALDRLPSAQGLPAQLAYEVAGLVALGIASGVYLSVDLGAGPRDGLMTGIHRRFGWRIAWVRTGLELSTLVFGFALGGTIGAGTLLLAFGSGFAVEWGLRHLRPRRPRDAASQGDRHGAGAGAGRRVTPARSMLGSHPTEV